MDQTLIAAGVAAVLGLIVVGFIAFRPKKKPAAAAGGPGKMVVCLRWHNGDIEPREFQPGHIVEWTNRDKSTTKYKLDDEYRHFNRTTGQPWFFVDAHTGRCYKMPKDGEQSHFSPNHYGKMMMGEIGTRLFGSGGAQNQWAKVALWLGLAIVGGLIVVVVVTQIG